MLKLNGQQDAYLAGEGAVPSTDIFEDARALYIMMDMPGVRREDVSVTLDKGLLQVHGKIDPNIFAGLEPVYAENTVDHFRRSFRVAEIIDRQGISAVMKDGVLTLTMPKVPEAQPKAIEIH